MSCEACTERLVELLYGELDGADRSGIEAHLEECTACAEAYERISVGKSFAARLPMEVPPDDGLREVFAAARKKAAAIRAEAPEPTGRRARAASKARASEAAHPGGAKASAALPEGDAPEGLWASLVSWVGGVAMRPQLAMAMTLLLMVGIGMWYLPTLRQSDPSDVHAIVDPSPGDEVGPSASLEPAEPLDLLADPRTGRMHQRDEDHERSVADRTPVSAARASEPRARDEEPATDPSGEPPADAADDEARFATRLTGEPADGRGEGATAPSATAPSASPTTAGTTPPDETSEPLAESAPAEAQTPPPAGADESESTFRRGMERYRRRQYRAAAQDFSDVVRRPGADARQLLPPALHHLARSQRGANNCAAAVRTYEQLLARHRGYAGSPEAMIEAADCYRRIGRLSDARRWLTEAQSHGAVASRARRDLTTIAAAERAHEAVNEPGDAEATEAEAPEAEAPED